MFRSVRSDERREWRSKLSEAKNCFEQRTGARIETMSKDVICRSDLKFSPGLDRLFSEHALLGGPVDGL